MNSFELVTPPSHLPITVADDALARAVVEEVERLILQRAIVHQTRKITIDGRISTRIELEPSTAITSLTRWTPTDPAEVVAEDTYDVVSRDPRGTVIAPSPGSAWPAPARDIGSFTLSYECGWTVAPESAAGAGDAVNEVPASVQLMIERAIEYRAGGAGQGDIRIGSLEMDKADSYQTDKLPRELTDIARAFFYRPGLFIGRP